MPAPPRATATGLRTATFGNDSGKKSSSPAYTVKATEVDLLGRRASSEDDW